MVRRTLLILVTGLIVARPFVLGEDPTLESPHMDAAGLLLTMLWLVAAAVWSVWRLWSRQGTWYGGVLEAMLFAFVLLTFAVAFFVAPYRHAARLMAWEWAGMAAAFLLVRQLAVSREEQQCFFAVLLAGVVPLTAYAVYQRGVEIPQLQQKYALDREKLRRDMAEQTGLPFEDDGLLQLQWERTQKSYVYATYANPNSFAGYLALLVPGLVGAALLCARHKHPRWQVMIATGFATLGVVALGLTISRGAWLAMLIAGLGAAVLLWRDWLRTHWYYALGAVALLALIAFGISKTELLTSAIGKDESTAMVRIREYWPATWKMIANHLWLGVGPGQFGRYYPRYMGETYGETIKEPHNFVLEIWATCGVFAVIALLAVFALFYWRTVRSVLSGPTVDGPGDVPLSDPRRSVEVLPVRWEFYVGGMFGLLLSFVLRVSEVSQDEIVGEGVKAGIGAILWFGALALFEQIQWSNRARVLALTTGVTATLLNLLVSGGINFPSVAIPLWCAVALALNSADLTPNPWISRFKPLVYLPLPALAAIAIVYLLTVFYPVANSGSAIRRATLDRYTLQKKSEKQPGLSAPLVQILSPRQLVEPLEKIRKEEDPDNARLALYLAELYGELWLSRQSYELFGKRLEKQQASKQVSQDAIRYAQMAQALDPEGRDGYRMEYQLRRMFADTRAYLAYPKRLPAKYGLSARMFQLFTSKDDPDYEDYRKEQEAEYFFAAQAMTRLIDLDPMDSRLHFQLADTLRKAGDPEAARPHAERARELHDRNKWPTRRLPNEQRKQLDEWLNEPGDR